MLNSVASYGYLLPTVYLFMADIENPDLFVCSCRTWICLDITRFCEEQRQPSNGSAWPACQKPENYWGREVSTQFSQQFPTTVRAPPLVGCVVWSLLLISFPSSILFIIYFLFSVFLNNNNNIYLKSNIQCI